MRFIAAITFAIVLITSLVWGISVETNPNFPLFASSSQQGTIFNSLNVSAADTAQSIVLTGAASERVRIYSLDAICDGGTATLTVDDDTTTIWGSGTLKVGSSSLLEKGWSPGLTGGVGNSMTVDITTCGGGNTSFLSIQADRF